MMSSIAPFYYFAQLVLPYHDFFKIRFVHSVQFSLSVIIQTIH